MFQIRIIYSFLFLSLFLRTMPLVASTSLDATKSVPLGVITEVDGSNIVVENDTSVEVSEGSLVAIFGLGSLERHPLTKKIILMGAEQVARAQVTEKQEESLSARIIWKDGDIEIIPGMDVVLLSGESAANSAPVLAGEIQVIKALTQESAHIEVPIMDPDGDFVVYSWKIEGNPGHSGFLDARVTYVPKIIWFTPSDEIKANLVVTATDSHFQTTTLKIPITTLLPNSLSQRELKPIGKFGRTVESNIRCLTRDDIGQWWGATANSLVTISSGWRQMKNVSFALNFALFRPVTLVPYRDNIHILDKRSRSIFVLRTDGTHLRSYGEFSTPTDMVITKGGTVYIADQVAGGILVYDIKGEFKKDIGGSDNNQERFINLTRLALGFNKELFALDQGTHIVHRFDSEMQRLAPWPLPLKGKEIPLDIAYHPRGYLLVLLDNGRIMTVIENGQLGMSMEPASGAYATNKLEDPDSIFIDMSGDIFVTYGNSGLIARYNPKGSLSGLRGAPLWALDKFTVDGAGQIYGLHKSKRTIHCFDHEGWLIKQIGSIGLNQHMLEDPIDIAVKPDGNEVVVPDTDSQKILRFQQANQGDPLSFILPERDPVQIHKNMTFVMDDLGRTYILDVKYRQVLIFDQDGQFLFKFGRGNLKGFTRDIQKPSLLAVDPKGKFIYLYDKYEIKMFEIDHDTGAAVHVVSVGSKGTGVAQFKKPIAMFCDRRGLLYILDKGRKDLQVVIFGGNELREIYTRKYEDWDLKSVDDMVVNPDGRVFLVSKGTVVTVGW